MPPAHPPPALSVDAAQQTRDGLVPLMAAGWCEFEFDTAERDGTAGEEPPPPDRQSDDPLGLVN